MGISSNQARFLALTARSIDLEYRTQQICQRRMRLSSELENIATAYNNAISDRQMYTMSSTNSGINSLTVANVKSLTDSNGSNYKILGLDNTGKYVSITTNTSATIPAGTNAIDYTAGATSASAAVLQMGTKTYSLSDLGLSAGASESDILEAALKNGVVSIASRADEFSQNPTAVTGTDAGNYDIKDWRTLPNIADELYQSDDADAENKYDKATDEINAQDKKLQLEQSSIEVEYKEVTSEKDAVKKILDTNAQSSFKYFS